MTTPKLELSSTTKAEVATPKRSRKPRTMKEFLAQEQEQREAQRELVAKSISAKEYHRQLRLEEFHEIGRGIGEALAAALPSEAIAALLKKAAFGD